MCGSVVSTITGERPMAGRTLNTPFETTTIHTKNYTECKVKIQSMGAAAYTKSGPFAEKNTNHQKNT
jgi:hypothetical protein